MLQASKAQVITEVHLDSISLRFLEVEYLLLVFNRVSVVAGILAGFGSTALIEGIGVNDHGAATQNGIVKNAFVLVCGVAIGSLLVCLAITTAATVWGPGLSLRGVGRQAMCEAVEHMEQASQHAFGYLCVGLGCYLASSIMISVIWLPFVPCLVALAVLVPGSWLIFWTARDTLENFAYVPKSCDLKGSPEVQKFLEDMENEQFVLSPINASPLKEDQNFDDVVSDSSDFEWPDGAGPSELDGLESVARHCYNNQFCHSFIECCIANTST